VNKKNIWGAAAALGALYLAAAGLKASAEIRRYNHMRAISGEGPLSEELPGLAKDILIDEGHALKELGNFMLSAPKDLARYLKIESM
jgi:hypothetical protein